MTTGTGAAAGAAAAAGHQTAAQPVGAAGALLIAAQCADAAGAPALTGAQTGGLEQVAVSHVVVMIAHNGMLSGMTAIWTGFLGHKHAYFVGLMLPHRP